MTDKLCTDIEPTPLKAELEAVLQHKILKD